MAMNGKTVCMAQVVTDDTWTLMKKGCWETEGWLR